MSVKKFRPIVDGKLQGNPVIIDEPGQEIPTLNEPKRAEHVLSDNAVLIALELLINAPMKQVEGVISELRAIAQFRQEQGKLK